MLTAYLYANEGQRSLVHHINSDCNLVETIGLVEKTIADHLPQVRSFLIENADGDALAVGVPHPA